MGKGCVDRRRPSCLSAYCASCTTAQRNPDPILVLSRTTRKPPTHLSFAARNRYESALANGGLSIGVPVHSRRASRKTRRSLSIPISDHVSFDKSITGAGVFRVLLYRTFAGNAPASPGLRPPPSVQSGADSQQDHHDRLDDIKRNNATRTESNRRKTTLSAEESQ